MHTYIHIPFCNQKCSYCKFALTPIFDDFKKKKYLHFLQKDIQNQLQKFPEKIITTIYFWWGTPSILTPSEIADIIQLFPEWNKEISFEANPEDISEKYLENIISLWINRLSIWIQTLNNQALDAVERKNSNSIFSALESIKKFKVWKVWKNILEKIPHFSVNIDLILWLPFVKKWEILQNLHFLHKHYDFITHTSVYILEKGKYPENWQKHSISDEEMYDEFQEICHYFQQKWWNHYEVSNFSKTWYECAHNLWYWNHTETLAFWLSASGLLQHNNSFIRYTNSPSFSWYYSQKTESETLSPSQVELEKFLFGIRTHGYRVSPQCDFLDIWQIEKLLQEWFLEGNTDYFKISIRGIPIIDAIIEKIIK